MNDTTLVSAMEKQLEDGLRQTFDNIPAIMLAEQATLLKEVTVKVCDEYIAIGRDYQREWALRIVRDMYGGEKGSDTSEH